MQGGFPVQIETERGDGDAAGSRLMPVI